MEKNTTPREDAMTICPLCKRPDFGPHLCQRTSRVTPLRDRKARALLAKVKA